MNSEAIKLIEAVDQRLIQNSDRLQKALEKRRASDLKVFTEVD